MENPGMFYDGHFPAKITLFPGIPMYAPVHATLAKMPMGMEVGAGK